MFDVRCSVRRAGSDFHCRHQPSAAEPWGHRRRDGSGRFDSGLLVPELCVYDLLLTDKRATSVYSRLSFDQGVIQGDAGAGWCAG